MPSSGTLYEVLDPKFRKSATEWLSGNQEIYKQDSVIKGLTGSLEDPDSKDAKGNVNNKPANALRNQSYSPKM